jgi:hypothetical protein
MKQAALLELTCAGLLALAACSPASSDAEHEPVLERTNALLAAPMPLWPSGALTSSPTTFSWFAVAQATQYRLGYIDWPSDIEMVDLSAR